MQVNIADLAANAGKKAPFSFERDAASLDIGAADYRIEGTVAVFGTVSYTGRRYRAEGIIRCTKSFDCDRCLKPCMEAQEHSFSEDFQRTDGGAVGDADEDANGFTGDAIDLSSLVRDTILAAQPLSKLCKPDCKGLCAVCGADLNEGDCGCDRSVLDPRLAALRDLWQQKDE